MPGTGHSARYKGSISNRSKISPFEHLAKWNQQLLGADGAVPSIVGGNSLEFKKLDATNIAGVMHNPAIANLNMSALTITNCNQINTRFISDVQQITGISNTGLSITTSDQDISINSGKNLRLTCGVNTTAASTSIDIRHANNKPGDINIGWETGTTANNDIVVGKGNTSTGDHQVRILSDTITGGDNRVLIGNPALTAASFQSLTTTIVGVNTLTLNGGSTRGSLTLGNTSTGLAGLTSETTTVTGTVRLNLITNPATTGNSGIYIGQTGDKIGFMGATPSLRTQINKVFPATVTLQQLANRLNYLISILDEAGGGGGVPAGMGLVFNGGNFSDTANG